MTVPWDAVQRLGQFAGLRADGDRIFKSEDNEDPDFRVLPAEVREALVVIGRLAPDEPIEKAEFPHTKEAADRAKAAAGTAVQEKPSKPLRPGEGRTIATAKLATMVTAYRKEHPTVTEARAWVAVLDTKEGARWYGLGEQGETESRRT